MAHVPGFAQRHGQEQATRYILREHASGRSLWEILSDPYVRNHCSPEQLDWLFEDPAVAHVLGEDVIAGIRRRLLV